MDVVIDPGRSDVLIDFLKFTYFFVVDENTFNEIASLIALLILISTVSSRTYIDKILNVLCLLFKIF